MRHMYLVEQRLQPKTDAPNSLKPRAAVPKTCKTESELGFEPVVLKQLLKKMFN